MEDSNEKILLILYTTIIFVPYKEKLGTEKDIL
jgi:hypothetical protein